MLVWLWFRPLLVFLNLLLLLLSRPSRLRSMKLYVPSHSCMTAVLQSSLNGSGSSRLSSIPIILVRRMLKLRDPMPLSSLTRNLALPFANTSLIPLQPSVIRTVWSNYSPMSFAQSTQHSCVAGSILNVLVNLVRASPISSRDYKICLSRQTYKLLIQSSSAYSNS